jgi:WD40 repeat protein
MRFGPNHGIEFSPDGALLAVCSAHHVEVIDARSRRVLRLIRGHAGWWRMSPSRPTAPSSSPDPTTARQDLGGRDGSGPGDAARARRPGQGGLVRDSWVYGVAFSPRGDLIATGSWDETARIWDAATGECLATLAGHAGTVEAVAFSPSRGAAGHRLGGRDRTGVGCRDRSASGHADPPAVRRVHHAAPRRPLQARRRPRRLPVVGGRAMPARASRGQQPLP